MSDLSDVEQAIVTTIAGLVYPLGSSNPSAVLNDAGQPMPVRLYRGWPVSANLDTDLAAGIMNISVYSRGTTERNTTRFHPDYQTVSTETATVAAAVNANNQVVITGTGAAGITQWVTVLVGTRAVAAYNVLATDGAASIAAALAAALTAAGVHATSTLGVVSLTASAAYVSAMVGVTGTQAAEWRRQETQIQITLWCPTPTERDNAARLIEPMLAKTTFLTMPDGFQARFRYHNTVVSDSAEKVVLYRRDLIYTAEYATTDLDTGWQVTAIDDNIAGSVGPLGTAPATVNLVPAPVQPTPAPNLWPGPPYQAVVPGPPGGEGAPGPIGAQPGAAPVFIPGP
jgi:hypothetical protein